MAANKAAADRIAGSAPEGIHFAAFDSPEYLGPGERAHVAGLGERVGNGAAVGGDKRLGSGARFAGDQDSARRRGDLLDVGLDGAHRGAGADHASGGAASRRGGCTRAARSGGGKAALDGGLGTVRR